MYEKLIGGDLLDMDVQAIVCPANIKPGALGGLDKIIYKKAGMDKMLEARKRIGKAGRLEISECGITEGFSLKQKKVIHAATPSYAIKDSDLYLYKCYRNALAAAFEAGISSVAFPLLSSGIMGFPQREATDIAEEVLKDPEYDDMFDRLLLVCRSEQRSLTERIHDNDYTDYYPDQLEELAVISKYEAEDQYEHFQAMLTQMKKDQRIIYEYYREKKAFQKKMSEPDHYDLQKCKELIDKYVGEGKRFKTLYRLKEHIKDRKGNLLTEDTINNLNKMYKGERGFTHDITVELMLVFQLSRKDALRFAVSANVRFPDPRELYDKTVLTCLEEHIYDWDSIVEENKKSAKKETPREK